jgi:hypothetical protein
MVLLNIKYHVILKIMIVEYIIVSIRLNFFADKKILNKISKMNNEYSRLFG